MAAFLGQCRLPDASRCADSDCGNLPMRRGCLDQHGPRYCGGAASGSLDGCCAIVSWGYLVRRALLPVLDATPAGRAVLLGTRALEIPGTCNDWSGRTRSIVRFTAVKEVKVRRLEEDDWPEIYLFRSKRVRRTDRSAAPILAQRLPQASLVAFRHGQLVGSRLAVTAAVVGKSGPSPLLMMMRLCHSWRHCLLFQGGRSTCPITLH